MRAIQSLIAAALAGAAFSAAPTWDYAALAQPACRRRAYSNGSIKARRQARKRRNVLLNRRAHRG